MAAQPDPTPAPVLVVGCGNLLRGDDAVGPLVVRRLAELGVPGQVELYDGGTAGLDVALALRGRELVVVVDAARTGAPPGTLTRVPGEALARLPAADAVDLHAFRWDHALALGRRLLADDYPRDVVVLLVEAGSLEPGADLTPAVAVALDRAVEWVHDELRRVEGQLSARAERAEPEPADDP